MPVGSRTPTFLSRYGICEVEQIGADLLAAGDGHSHPLLFGPVPEIAQFWGRVIMWLDSWLNLVYTIFVTLLPIIVMSILG